MTPPPPPVAATTTTATATDLMVEERKPKLELLELGDADVMDSARRDRGITERRKNQGRKLGSLAAAKQRKRENRKTVLEQHCAFFDTDNDGVIWPSETFATCRSFEWSLPLSLFFTGFLHAVQSWGTVPWSHGLPDPLFRIWVDNVRFNKHGSSTMAFDSHGNFRPDRLDEFFDLYDTDEKGGLTFWEGWRALRGIRMVWDAFGQVSAMFEWGFTYLLLWPEDGVIRREDAHRVLDGSIFHEKVKQKRKGDVADGKKPI